MKIISVCCYMLIAIAMMACNKSPMSQTQTEARAIHIAGMPVYDRDYLLSVGDNNSVALRP